MDWPALLKPANAGMRTPFWSPAAAGPPRKPRARKRAIDGRYHAFKQAKYARRYLAEAAYRFNRRFRLRSMLQRLVHAMIFCKPCAETKLRATSNFLG